MSDEATNPLVDEIRQAARPKRDLVLPPRPDLPDAAVETRTREIGEKWGAATQIVSSVEAGTGAYRAAHQRAVRLPGLSRHGHIGEGCRAERHKDLSHPQGAQGSWIRAAGSGPGG